MANPQRILVIDDEPDVGKIVCAAARAIGLHCAATTDASTFLKELTPDITLILLDLIMPGMDGVELLRQLAQQECKAGIILMSGVGSRVLETAEQLAQTLGLPIVGHLNKPFRLKELQSMLARNTAISTLLATGSKSHTVIPDQDLHGAIEKDEFLLHYQPQIDIATGKVIGIERGLIFPDDFISRLESLGLIDQLGWIVINRGLSEVSQFAEIDGAAPKLSLNVSVLSLRDLKFPDNFLSLVNKHHISPANLTIEITETGLIKELSQTLDVLTRLRMKQVQLSIDDFGTGYAMMQQLINIPATEIKIDKSFVQNIDLHERDRVMVQKTIEIGHELGMKVIGEGVETQEQFDFLRFNHCDVVQGYLFSRPLAVGDLLNWLREYRSHQTH
jgi:EAL domain-containing protein (putative c-di-GMP-specific phosphodiesterase class I)/CheY-like chemotaxis protein